MKTILVTGGSTALGKNFIELYKKKYDIVAPAETDFTVYDEVATLFHDNKFSAVVHLAEYEDEARSYNLVAFQNLQHACLLQGVPKLIVATSVADVECPRPIEDAAEEELGVCVPHSPHASGAYLTSVLAEKDKITTVLRFFTVYGKYARIENNCTAEILSHAVTGKKEIVLDANRQLSVIYDDDACKIIAAFLERDLPQGTYNIASPTPVALYDFAKKAKAYAKKNARELTLTLAKRDDAPCTANTNKLMRVLGEFKFTAFGTGVNKTLDHYQKHKGQFKRK